MPHHLMEMRWLKQVEEKPTMLMQELQCMCGLKEQKNIAAKQNDLIKAQKAAEEAEKKAAEAAAQAEEAAIQIDSTHATSQQVIENLDNIEEQEKED